MDNGSSHRGQKSIERLTQAHPRVVPVHGPVHASWLNQIEIYFSIVQRKGRRQRDGAAFKRFGRSKKIRVEREPGPAAPAELASDAHLRSATIEPRRSRSGAADRRRSTRVATSGPCTTPRRTAGGVSSQRPTLTAHRAGNTVVPAQDTALKRTAYCNREPSDSCLTPGISTSVGGSVWRLTNRTSHRLPMRSICPGCP